MERAPRTASELRRAFLGFFEQRGHAVVASSGLIPHHPTAPLFTNAGMNQFVPYFLAEEPSPYRTATSVQKCVRTADIELVGTTTRHLTFFEMLGNFSFGDYFKEGAIQLAWELSTEVLGLDGDRIWATVYLDDDEAHAIWRDTIGLPEERVQRLGEADNFWEMQKGAPGPCGPNTELYYDRGSELGSGGGPATGGEERYLEFWNLVFMQHNREPDGRLAELPSRNVDTGAGFERNLVLLQGVPTVFETDVFAPLLERAQLLTGTRYGDDATSDASLRILADHARAVTFLVADGVFPTNEDRGYVLRRVLRRAVRHAYRLGVGDAVMPSLAEETMDQMGEAYPELVENRDFILDVLSREEESFRRTLATGLALLDAELESLGSGDTLSGSVAFALHDTHGFPLELTREIAEERGIEVDAASFDVEMDLQRERARAATRREGTPVDLDDFQAVLERHGPTDFVGREEFEVKAVVLAAIDGSIVLDRSPFYAESGGQVGDVGTIRSETGESRVVDTLYALPGLQRHVVESVDGEILVGQEILASIDVDRRDAIRRNHTATHILHWALREVLGDHVKQQGSLVAPERLRFDFSHFEPVSREQMAEIEDLANREILANHPVRHYETSREHAQEVGAVAFFGEKYGEFVRVLEAGPHSIELCGGTHVRALGDIGSIKVVSEGSIGSNIRRVEALTGLSTIARLRRDEQQLEMAAEVLGVSPDEVISGAQRKAAEVRDLRREVERLRRQAAIASAGALAASATDGVVVARVDSLDRAGLRELAVAVRDHDEVRAVVLGGEVDGGGAALVAVVVPDSGLDAADLLDGSGALIAGGGRPDAEITVLGGKDPGGIEEALALARSRAGTPAS